MNTLLSFLAFGEIGEIITVIKDFWEVVKEAIPLIVNIIKYLCGGGAVIMTLVLAAANSRGVNLGAKAGEITITVALVAGLIELVQRVFLT